jgi:hypothetical protein
MADLWFSDRVILIISPESWSQMHLSKHHYAKKLAEVATAVYFLGPPKVTGPLVSIRRIEGFGNLFEVNYHRVIPSVMAERWTWLFNRLLLIQGLILRAFLPRIDLVWSFELVRMPCLRVFGANICIFHPVERVASAQQWSAAREADLCLSVAEDILRDIPECGVGKRLLPHGLADDFLRVYPDEGERSDFISMGYVGSLVGETLNREAVLMLVRMNPTVRFVFWGETGVRTRHIHSSAGAPGDASDFVQELERMENVELRGPCSTEVLAKEMNFGIDGFFVAYRKQVGEDVVNSHKIIEYLSTGKRVVGSPIGFYKNRPDLYRSSQSSSRESVVAEISQVIKEIQEVRDDGGAPCRRGFAFRNSYDQHIKRVSEWIHTIANE